MVYVIRSCVCVHRKQGISYYNPQLAEWSTHYIPMEASVKDNCQILLYVVSPVTRGITSMLEVSSYVELQHRSFK